MDLIEAESLEDNRADRHSVSAVESLSKNPEDISRIVLKYHSPSSYSARLCLTKSAKQSPSAASVIIFALEIEDMWELNLCFWMTKD